MAAPVLLLAVAGCLDDDRRPDDGTGMGLPPLAFGPPVKLTTAGPGFEPSIDVAADGTVYAAAAKSHRPLDGGHLSSWLWYSTDSGATWSTLPSPAAAHALVPGLEGDTAVDGDGRFYFIDTYLADNAVHVWAPGESGPEWQWSRPLQGTRAVMDDRPWLAAHGDGILHLMSNQAAGTDGVQVVSTSRDAGLTWLDAYTVPGSRFCQVAASPADDVSATIACYNGDSAGAETTIHDTADQGRTWGQAAAFTLELGPGYLSPSAAFDAAGNAYAAWHDEQITWSNVQDVAWTGEQPARIQFARRIEGAWQPLDVTPFAGRFGMAYLCAGLDGTAAVVSYATTDLAPNAATQWRAFALVTADAMAPAPTWQVADIGGMVLGTGPVPPRDLFQCAFGPDNVLHAVVQQDWQDDPARKPGDGIAADVFHVAQASGANLA